MSSTATYFCVSLRTPSAPTGKYCPSPGSEKVTLALQRSCQLRKHYTGLARTITLSGFGEDGHPVYTTCTARGWSLQKSMASCRSFKSFVEGCRHPSYSLRLVILLPLWFHPGRRSLNLFSCCFVVVDDGTDVCIRDDDHDRA